MAGAMKRAVERFFRLAHVDPVEGIQEILQPEEVKRLDEAIVRQSGKYVVVVVTEDTDAAEAVLKEYLG